MNNELPPLPEPALWFDAETEQFSRSEPLRPTYDTFYTADQLRAYAAAAVAAERERCFSLVMDAPNACVLEEDGFDVYDAMKAMAVSVASKIRTATT